MGIVIAVTSGKGWDGQDLVTGGGRLLSGPLGKRVLCIDMDIGLRNLDISLASATGH